MTGKKTFEKNTRESIATVMTKKCRKNEKLISFGQLMKYSSFNYNLQLQWKSEYEWVNWESIRSTYEQIQEIIVESYPKTNKESKDFPDLKTCSCIAFFTVLVFFLIIKIYSVLIQYCVHICEIVQKITSLHMMFCYVPLRRA